MRPTISLLLIALLVAATTTCVRVPGPNSFDFESHCRTYSPGAGGETMATEEPCGLNQNAVCRAFANVWDLSFPDQDACVRECDAVSHQQARLHPLDGCSEIISYARTLCRRACADRYGAR